MHSAYMLSLPALLTETASLLAGLPLSDLPPLANIKTGYDPMSGTFEISAQLWAGGDELEQINAVRAWAVALNGVTLLGDEVDLIDSTFRHIEAIKALDYGASFSVWTHVAKQAAPAPSELVSA